MADLRLFANTSNIVRFVLKHATTGQGLTGLTSASSGLIISTIADNEATATAYTVAGSTIEGITTLGTFAAPTATKCRFKEVDATNHKGLYEFQFADARFAVASSRRLVISVTGATNLLDTDYEIQLVQFNPYDSVRLGLTALPNAAAEAAGGLFTRGTGAGQINQAANGMIDTNPVRLNNVSQSLLDLKDFADDGYDPSTNKVQGVVLTDTVTTYTGNTPQTGDSFARLGAPAGASVSADIAAIEAQTDDIGAAGAGLTAIPWNASWDAEVQSEVDDALVARALDHLVNVAVAGADVADDSIIAKLVSKSATADWDSYVNTTDSLEANRDNLGTNGAALSLAKTTNITGFNDLSAAQVNAEADTALSDYDPPTHAELVSEINSVQADIAALNNLSAAQVNAEVDTALADVNLDHLVGTATGIPAIPAGTYIDQMMDDGTAVYDRTTDSLQAIRDRGDAAWTTGSTPPTAAAIADAVWDETLSGHLGAGSTGEALNAAGAAGDPWTTALPGAYGAGSAGNIIGNNLNATVSSRASQTSLDTLDDFVDTEVNAIKTKTDQLTFTTTNKVDATIQAAGDFAQAAADKVWLTTSRTLSAFGFSVTVGTNSDKTGYTLSAAGIQAIWDALTSALTTAGSIGKLLVDNVNATISSRSSHSAADVWAVATRILTAGTNIVLAKGTGVTGFNDLSAAQVNAEVDTALADYDAPTSAELVTEINSVQADIAALNNLSAAQVNAEVVDALNVDTYAEPGQGAPAATTTLAAKINYLYKAFRNRKTQTSTTLSLYADNATTVDQKATISDDGTVYDHGELGTGP